MGTLLAALTLALTACGGGSTGGPIATASGTAAAPPAATGGTVPTTPRATATSPAAATTTTTSAAPASHTAGRASEGGAAAAAEPQTTASPGAQGADTTPAGGGAAAQATPSDATPEPSSAPPATTPAASAPAADPQPAGTPIDELAVVALVRRASPVHYYQQGTVTGTFDGTMALEAIITSRGVVVHFTATVASGTIAGRGLATPVIGVSPWSELRGSAVILRGTGRYAGIHGRRLTVGGHAKLDGSRARVRLTGTVLLLTAATRRAGRGRRPRARGRGP